MALVQNPVAVITLDATTPLSIPKPHTLYTASTLPQRVEPHHTFYLILPSQPYTKLLPSSTRHLLHLTTILPKQNVFLLFPNYLAPQHTHPYETLFSAPSLTSHPARNLLSSLPSTTTTTTKLTLTLPPKTLLENFLIIHPSSTAPKLPNTATLVALGASPPPTHTLTAIPGYRLTHIPTKNSTTAQFLSRLHSKNHTFLLRFPDDNHLFLHKHHHTWHGLLLPKFPTSAIPYLNPVSISKYLNHPPRLPIHRPLLRLPTYSKLPSTPPNFETAVHIVAHRIHKASPYHPPTSASLITLDTKILSHRIKLSSLPSTTKLKKARFDRLHARANKRKGQALSVTAPKQKRLKTHYFATSLSTLLASLTKHPKFFHHPYPCLSWERPDDQVFVEDRFFRSHGIHGIEFCHESRDAFIRSCENLIGKSVVEFAYSNIGKIGVRKVKRALAMLQSNKLSDSRETSSKRLCKLVDHYKEILRRPSSSVATL